MQVGLFHTVQWPEGTNQRERYQQAIEQALLAEEAGFDSVWLTEHHFSRHGIVSDSISVLCHLAARTTSIRLGTAVAVLPLHHPLRLAEAAATLDVVSDGRLDFGIGKGYQPGEFRGFGLTLDDREARFNEALDIILRGWTSTTPFSHEGPYWSFQDADPQPKPIQTPHPPIWMATDSDGGFRKCAERGFGVLLPQGRSLSAVAEQLSRYRAALEAVGRPYEPDKVALARALYVGPTIEAAWDDVTGPYQQFLDYAGRLAGPGGSPSQHASGDPFKLTASVNDSVLFGSPASVLSTLREIEKLGVSRVIMFVHIGGLPHEQIMRSMRLFRAEVMPALGSSVAGNAGMVASVVSQSGSGD